jgi:hypothetical protein
MNNRIRTVFIILITLLLASCAPQDLRSQATNTFSSTISADGCQPDHWVVPGGATITATFTNSNSDSAQWSVLIYPATPAYDGLQEKDFFITFSIPADNTTTEKFTAPAMPGEYQVLCGEANALDKTPKSTLIVVQP